MKREYVKWYSPHLQKEIELLVFGCSGVPVIFFPTRTARFYDYENWKIIEALEQKISDGGLQVFCLDSVDIESFYSPLHPCDKMKRHLQYEQYILQEVLPFVKNKNNNPRVIAAGCSLGGYHAMNIALRHPGYFSKVVGMSARYDLTASSLKFHDLLDGYFDENVYYNMPSMFVPNIADEMLLEDIKKLKIILAVGKEDPFLNNNTALNNALRNKNIETDFYIWEEEAHRPKYWRQMVQLYL